ncbi:MAG: PEP-CTERM sorting domain-containing protein [Chlorobia bacterium]|nr:PEP-CTERM sorting domain-containing protein [Fimbriimonadaceae bacterium]
MRGSFAVLASGFVVLSFAQTIDPFYAGDYSYTSLGSVPDLPTSYGGLTLKFDDPNTLLIGGAANGAAGAIYSIGVTRDGNNHITGFSGSATLFATAPQIDGGLAYGPGNVLFAAGFPNNAIMQFKLGSSSPDRNDDVSGIGIASSLGALNFVPAGFNGAGRMKAVSFSTGGFYDVLFSADGVGTYNLDSATLADTIIGGPEGFVYVPQGSALFGVQSMLVSEWSVGNIAAYDIDAQGNPIFATRRDFMTGLSGAEGAFIDPLTGDFLFSTFGGSNQVIVVQGFSAPVPEPATMAALGIGVLALIRRRKSK